MRKNRKRRNVKIIQTSRGGLMWFFALLVIGVIQGIFYLAVGNSSRAIMKDIKVLEHEQHSIEKDLSSQQAQWADCTTPEKLEECIVRHGLDMELASGEQIVSLRGGKGAGRPSGGPGAYVSNHRRP